MPATHKGQPWLDRVQFTLGLSQGELAHLLGVSRRSVVRWRGNPGLLVTSQAERLVAALLARDVDLAREVATKHNLAWKNLPAQPEPPPPSPPSLPSLPATPPPKETSKAHAAHLVDSIVCAAAEAMSTTPQAIRPALLAAFDRATQMGLPTETICAVLSDRREASSTAEASPRAGTTSR